MEDMLYLWIDGMRRANLPVSPTLAIAKAKRIAEQLSISEDDFKASWQWLSRFRERRGLQKLLLHGEGAEVDKQEPNFLAALNSLYDIIAQYEPENVYNMDEAGLFFRLLPRYTLLMPFEDVSSTRGKRKAKDRLSLVVCANGTGTHKIPCTLIGKPKSPACIKNRDWPLKYFSQGKAWMDVNTCWKWFNEVFCPEVKKRTGRRVLLLMDNASGHFQAFERNNVRVVFFPPNCTSWKQPCDMGIIAALKKSPKRRASERLPKGAAGVVYGKPAHLLDAAFYVKRAWNLISDTSISNSFIKAELGPLTLQGSVDEEVDAMSDVLQRFRSLNFVIEGDELNEFMHVDDENNEEYSQAMLDDVNEVLTTIHTENDDSDDDSDDQSNTSAPIENEVIFHGFEQLYRKILEIEDQLLCTDVQAQAGDAYGDPKDTFEKFQRKLR
ncbi:hypothetical protein LOD99_12006 [Oopsacas minuta]|uniref:HTH CENPB-type domain-containing protein n=1 Tax=Oopsacas minuta TaxID=111878 RepID=A0AAV7JH18_9METZ|nr:hypothetical protein LOD99_12006 [Oopsacas minuta]